MDFSTSEELKDLIRLLDQNQVGISLRVGSTELFGAHWSPQADSRQVEFFEGVWRIQGPLNQGLIDSASRIVSSVLSALKLETRNAYLEEEVKALDQSEHTLRMRERELRRLVDVSPFLLIVEDTSSRIEYLNHGLQGLIRRDLEDVEGERLHELDPRFEFLIEMRAEVGKAMTKVEREIYFDSGDEGIHWNCVAFPELAQDGSLARFVCIMSDVTVRKHSETALQLSHANYRELFHRSGDVVLLIEPVSGTILDINDGTEVRLGLLREEVVGETFQTLTERVSTHAFGFAEGSWQTIFRTGVAFDWPLRNSKTGELCWLQMVFEPLQLSGDSRVLGLGRDVTEQKRDSDQWVDLEAAQDFLLDSKVVHDFSNLLSVILNGVELLSLSGDDELRDRLASVRTAAHQAAAITRVLVERRKRPHRGVILVVEDEPGVLSAVRRILAREGFEILAARHGDEALEISKNYDGGIDLLLTDVVMPGMAGPDLALEMKALRPNLGLLYMSAYSELVTTPGLRVGNVALLAKPFSSEELLRAIESTLNTGTKAPQPHSKGET